MYQRKSRNPYKIYQPNIRQIIQVTEQKEFLTKIIKK